jgi:hypothetical protein
MNQLALIPRFPRARRDDARSSHDAAARLEQSGADKRQLAQVLAAYRRFPNSTTAEVAKFARLNRPMVARRSPELGKTGDLLRYAPTKDTKPCEVTGIRCVRWTPRLEFTSSNRP